MPENFSSPSDPGFSQRHSAETGVKNGSALGKKATHSGKMSKLQRRALSAAFAGAFMEWYDFYLFGTASALVFPVVFFHGSDPTVALIESFGGFAAGFLPRPIGAIIFGHYGDKIGRKPMLLITVLLMGVCTVLIGLLPGYAQLGAAAPFLLYLMRLIQGIGIGGEFGGGALTAVENAPKEKRGLFGSFHQLGTPCGLLVSTGLFSLVQLLPEEQMLAWGWRIPFLLAAPLLGIAVYIRAHLPETETFKAAQATPSQAVPTPAVSEQVTDHAAQTQALEQPSASHSALPSSQDAPSSSSMLTPAPNTLPLPHSEDAPGVRAGNVEQPAGRTEKSQVPILALLKENPKNLLLGIGARMADAVTFNVINVFGIAFATTHLGLSKSMMLNGFVVSSAVQMVCLPFFGQMSDRIGRKNTYLLGIAVSALGGALYFPALKLGSVALTWLMIILTHAIGTGLMFSIQGTLFAELFGTRSRYTGLGVVYQTSALLGGAPTPALVTAMVAAASFSYLPAAAYVVIMCVLSALCIAFASVRQQAELHQF